VYLLEFFTLGTSHLGFMFLVNSGIAVKTKLAAGILALANRAVNSRECEEAGFRKAKC